MPVWGSLYFQNAVSPVMEQLIFFHDHVIIVLIVVVVVVGYILLSSEIIKRFNRGVFGGQRMEMVWTVLPAVFLLFIAFPSLKLLYMMEELESPGLRLKAVGHQWYWRYEYADLDVKMFESYMVPDSRSIFRLLEVDNCVSLPVGVEIRMVISSRDVIHSWTVPSLGVKADGIPGRLNQVLFISNRSGVFVGQCSEICGSNHSFIPIVLEFVRIDDFIGEWK